jgi:hypothetical protein
MLEVQTKKVGAKAANTTGIKSALTRRDGSLVKVIMYVGGPKFFTNYLKDDDYFTDSNVMGEAVAA